MLHPAFDYRMNSYDLRGRATASYLIQRCAVSLKMDLKSPASAVPRKMLTRIEGVSTGIAPNSMISRLLKAVPTG
jgi:hypothetical protein